MTNNPLVEALRTIQVNFCRMNCPHGAEQNWPHDPACETLRQSVAALASSAPATGEREQIVGWQPIDTAPKDGTEILILAHGMAIQARFEPGRWTEETPLAPREYDGPVWCGFDDQVAFEIEEIGLDDFLHGPVTHWMPLPPAPTDHRTQSGEMEGGEHG